MRRLRLRLLLERTPPGPRRELVRLRGRLLAAATARAPRDGATTTLLADARAVAAQLDAHLAAMLTHPDEERVASALPELRQQVGEVEEALVQARLGATAVTPALLAESVAELREAVARERGAAAEAEAHLRGPRGLPPGPGHADPTA
jgi:ATP-dependent DNA ligase